MTRVLIDEFLNPKILIVSGKGGVGKTTVAAALALVAARNGRRVCIAEVDRKGTLPHLFGGGDMAYEPRELSPGVWGINILAEDALAEYLRVQYRMRRIARIFRTTQFVDLITTAAPGLKDILMLGKIWYLEQNRDTTGTRYDFDTIIVDAPAAGHMITFLQAPRGLSDAVRVGPVQRQAEWLRDMLCDPARTRVHFVTLAEEMPVQETIETSDAIRGRLGIAQGAVFANAIYSDLFNKKEDALLDRLTNDDSLDEFAVEAGGVGLSIDAEDMEVLLGYARFLRARQRIQKGHLRTLRRKVSAPVATLPFLFSAGLALPDIDTLADVIESQVEEM